MAQLEAKQKSALLLPEEVNRLKDEVSLKVDLLQRRKDEASMAHSKTETKLQSLQKLSNLYGEKLGLHFVHTNSASGDASDNDNALRIGFTQIDRRNPEKKFWFDVRIMSDDTYSVQDVSPQVNGVKDLEKELNADQDFSKFVRKMRRKFKESV